jgi:hypothetical protein
MAVVLFAATTLVLGSWVAVVAKDEEISPIAPVTGRLEVAWQPGGTFDVRDRVFQYGGFLVGVRPVISPTHASRGRWKPIGAGTSLPRATSPCRPGAP